MKTRKLWAVLLLSLTTAGCFSAVDEGPKPYIPHAARNAARFAQELTFAGRVTPLPLPRPSAMLGPYVAAFLSLPILDLTHAAVQGVTASMVFLSEDNGVRDESYALLEELGIVISVDLQDVLNRSLNRQETLDAYHETLRDVAVRSQEHLAELETRLDDATEEQREVRSRAATAQRSLNNALRAKDYATASTMQAEVSKAQTELATVDGRVKELRSVINLFEGSLELAAERSVAIDENRDALIAGVSVLDIPGAEELGVLRAGNRRRGLDVETVFGPTD